MPRLRVEATAPMAAAIRAAAGTRAAVDTPKVPGHTGARFVEAAAPTE